MNELIQTVESDNGALLVSGRELHEFLEVRTPYDKWFPRMAEYGFEEGMDFSTNLSKSTGGRPAHDHQVKLDMAKEIAMLQRTEKGKIARQYFLELERRWNSPEMVMKRAMDYLNGQVAKLQTSNLVLEQRVNELQPKASYYDLVLQNKSLISMTQIAKDYGMGAASMNRILSDLKVQYKAGGVWLLYRKYQDKGYTQSSVHIIDSETSKSWTKWTQQGRLFIYDLLKSEGILPMIERESVEV